MTALSVNLNKIALLRNSRDGDYPSVLAFAQLAIQAGANGITVHPRPDQRHIRVDDIDVLSAYIKPMENIEFNIEGNPFASPLSSKHYSDYPGLMTLVESAKPNQVTLVPDSNDQLTSDHGFDLKRDGERLQPILDQLKNWQVRSSLFMDPDKEQIRLAREIGANRIELYTGPYAAAHRASPAESAASINLYREAADYARSIGLGVNAGHDLNLDNLADFLSIEGIDEVSIGHALTIDALLLGYKQAILDYSKLCPQ